MKMFNNMLMCEIMEEKVSTSEGFEITDKFEFKKLTVLHSAEEDITSGDIVEVKSTAGHKHPMGDNILIIHRGDVIFKH